MLFAIDVYAYGNSDASFISSLLTQSFIIIGMKYLPDKMLEKLYEKDTFKAIAEQRLIESISMLNYINVSTNYELLLNAKLDSKNYEIQRDNNNKRILVQNKYIMVPTHNPMFNNEVETQMTSIHQEYIVGTDEWSLSVGLNQKNKQKVLSPFFSPAKR